MSRHKSFTLSRDGLKPGCYVPLRLRIVDTLSAASMIPISVAIMGIMMVSFRWADQVSQFGFIAFITYQFVVLIVGSLLAFWAGDHVLRIAFRFTGMMTKEEAHDFPLGAGHRRIDPWPNSWQRPRPTESLDRR